MSPATATAHLGLGSNVGDPRANLERALEELAGRGVRPVASSSTYRTDPVGLVLDQPPFLNAAVAVVTDLAPLDLLRVAKEVEAALGRDLGGVRHGPRPLDVDLLLLGASAVDEPDLTVPHPALLERRFALIPLLELDFDLATPDGTRLRDALAVLPVDDAVVLDGPPLPLPRGG